MLAVRWLPGARAITPKRNACAPTSWPIRQLKTLREFSVLRTRNAALWDHPPIPEQCPRLQEEDHA